MVCYRSSTAAPLANKKLALKKSKSTLFPCFAVIEPSRPFLGHIITCIKISTKRCFTISMAFELCAYLIFWGNKKPPVGGRQFLLYIIYHFFRFVSAKKVQKKCKAKITPKALNTGLFC
jgi:hypothetical protein